VDGEFRWGRRRGGRIPLLMRVWGVTDDQREFAEFYAAAWDDCLRIVMVSAGSWGAERSGRRYAGLPSRGHG
jgi:hypothetical protein